LSFLQSRALTWIAALPDALEGKDQEVIDEILGKDITPASFENKATCDGKAANAFCYTLVNIYAWRISLFFKPFWRIFLVFQTILADFLVFSNHFGGFPCLFKPLWRISLFFKPFWRILLFFQTILAGF
jgi:hypothetical protein